MTRLTRARPNPVPPQSLEAERALLGSVLLDNGALNVALEQLSKDDFFSQGHRLTFEKMMTISQKNRTIDLVTLSEELTKAGLLEKVGGAAYLAALTDGVPVGSAASVTEYSRIVKEKSVTRQLINASNNIISRCLEATDDAETLIDLAQSQIFEIAKQHACRREFGALACEIRPEKVTWIWPGRVPDSKLTILEGDPGLGKSLLTTDMAARVSKGAPMPDGTVGKCGPADVILLSAEDGAGDTIVPRLVAAGADLTRIRIVPGPSEGTDLTITIPGSLRYIEMAIQSVGAKLVIIDPLVAFLNGETNSWRDQDVRRALAPLARMADRLNVAVLLIRHLSKAPSVNPLYRGGGSIGIIGAARAAFLVAPDPDIEGRTVFAASKFNLGPKPASLAYGLETVHVEGVGLVPRITWQGESQHSAATLNWAQSMGREETGALGEAKDFLLSVLADGPTPAKELRKQARSQGIADRTIDRAKSALKVRAIKTSFAGHCAWQWVLPDNSTKDAKVGLKDATNEHLASFAQAVEKQPVESNSCGKDAKQTISTHLACALASFDEVVEI